MKDVQLVPMSCFPMKNFQAVPTSLKRTTEAQEL